MNTIENNGGEVHLVGGCVRDMLIGKEPNDYDLVTNLLPDAIMELFKNEKTLKIEGKSFGVVSVNDIEIATYRRDKYYYGMHKNGADVVEFSEDIIEDMQRRDFTINALTMSSDGKVQDWLEQGLEDLNSKTIRFVGEPRERIMEDPCRIIRAMRFCSQLGFTILPHHIDIISDMRASVQLVAKERIYNELLRIMCSGHITASLNAMILTDTMAYIIPPLWGCWGCVQNRYHQDNVLWHSIYAADAMEHSILLKIAMLLHDCGKPCVKIFSKETNDFRFRGHDDVSEYIAREYFTNYKFSNDQINFMCEVIKNHMFFLNDVNASAIRRMMGRLKYCTIRDLLRARIADIRGNLLRASDLKASWVKDKLNMIHKIEKEQNALRITDLAIGGDDLIKLGLNPGILFKQILQYCLDKVIENPEQNNYGTLMDCVAEYLTKEGK